jgi:hypothetical protein
MAKATLKLVQNDNLYQIESGIPLPKPATRSGSKYPFAQMRIGDSFVVDKKQTNFGNTVHWAGKKTGFKFTTRAIDPTTTRVWRIK